MAFTFSLQEDFSAGEVSPRLGGRVSSQQWRSGVPKLENAIVTRFGTAKKREGTEFILSLANTAAQGIPTSTNGAPAALFPWHIPNHGSFLVVMRQDGGFAMMDVATESLIQQDIASGFTWRSHPFASYDVFKLKARQWGSDLIFTHPDHPPQVLRYVDADLQGLIDNVVVRWINFEANTRDSFADGDAATEVGPKLDPEARTVQMEIREVDTVLVCDTDFFNENDAYRSIWRVNGGYYHARGFGNARGLVVSKLQAGTTNDVPTLDWIGPWTRAGGGAQPSVTIDEFDLAGDAPDGSDAGDRVLVTFGSAVTNPQSRVGSILEAGAASTAFQWFVLITRYQSQDTVFEGLLLKKGGAFPAVLANTNFWSLAERELQRPTISIGHTEEGEGTTLVASADFFTTAMFEESPPGDNRVHKMLLYMHGGVVELETRTNAQNCTAVIQRELDSALPTSQWGRSWSNDSGYPSAMAVHQGRLYLSGIPQFPGRLYGSVVARPYNFTGNSGLATDRINWQLGADEACDVVWMQSAKDLLIGTRSGEFALRGQPATANNLAFERQSTYGSAPDVDPIQVQQSVLFVPITGNQIRQMAFREDRDVFEAPDLTDLSEHLFRGQSKIRQLSYKRGENDLVFALLTDGTVLCCSYRPENGVRAWSPWVGESWEAIAQVPAASEDTGYVCAKRNVNGTDKYFLEKIYEENGFPLDSRSEFTSFAWPIQLDHLAGESVAYNADGTHGTATVPGNGQLNLQAEIGTPTNFKVGRAVDFRITAQYAYEQRGNGSMAGQQRAISESHVLLEDTIGLEYYDGALVDPWKMKALEGEFGETPTAVSGWRTFGPMTQVGTQSTAQFRHQLAQRCEIVAINTIRETGTES